MTHWLFLPLDGRPCNARFPVELAALAHARLRTPPLESLGDARTPARRDRLQAWLESGLEGAQGLILSLDTWLYGNLVASRKNSDSLEALQARLDLLRRFKADHPSLKIHAFATLLRLSNSNDDTEERPYWASHGMQIYRYAWLEHKLSEAPDPALQAEFEALQTAIPPHVLADYRGLRARNYALLEGMLALQAEGLLETLLIGCDDGGSHGWTIQERNRLQAKIEAAGLSERTLLYPGADELACTLLARVLVPHAPKIAVAWTWPETQAQISRYEGLPLDQTLAHQARAAGVELVSDAAQAQGLLWVHNPAPGAQIDQYLDRDSRVALDPVRVSPLLHALSGSRPVALADVLYANGGDIALLETLERDKLLFSLSGYAAWNTAGNSLGMLLAWFKLRLGTAVDARLQRRFLIERLADDGWYQGYLRQQLCAHYSEPVTLNSCVRAIAYFNDKFRDWQAWMPEPPPNLQILRLSFPWKRFFEVDLQACDKPYDPANGCPT